MTTLNPLEIAILGLLEGPLWNLEDLKLALCPEHTHDELLIALRRLQHKSLIEQIPGRIDGERFFMPTASGVHQRNTQRQQQISLFREKETTHAHA